MLRVIARNIDKLLTIESTVKDLSMVKVRFLLASVFSFCLLAVPADAGQLASWKFDASKNRLDFKTDAAVQPKAVMLINPTRLVIDLPGISFPKSTITQKLVGNFRSLRVGQFENGTARLVLELQPGYTLNPKRVQFTGENPIDWYVVIPVPERAATLPTTAPNLPR
jgi:N-acetylmuramoyl-L-alanine amidase